MKSKKNLYFLVPAVLFIWGVIIYRIIDFSSEPLTTPVSRAYSLPQREAEKEEQYQLKGRYPDPFLKNVDQSAGEEDDEVEPNDVPTATPIPEEKPLNVQYRGFISESGTQEKIALLVVEGKEVFLKQGVDYLDIRISEIRTDSVSIAITGGIRWVRKE